MAAAFTTRYSHDALVDVVRDVSRRADPADPTAVAPGSFDEARAAAGHPHAPAAKQIVRRLKLGWYELLEFAHAPAGPSITHWLGLMGRDAPRDVAPDEVVVALRLVAARAGLDGLWPARYTAERDAMIAAQHRTHRHGSPSLEALPTVAQIERQYGWDAACRLAGLGQHDGRGDRIRGLSQVEISDRFIDDVGCLPWSIAAIERYARARDVPTVKLYAVSRYVAAVTETRAAAGKWTPPRPPGFDARPDETEIHDAGAGTTDASKLAGSLGASRRLLGMTSTT